MSSISEAAVVPPPRALRTAPRRRAPGTSPRVQAPVPLVPTRARERTRARARRAQRWMRARRAADEWRREGSIYLGEEIIRRVCRCHACPRPFTAAKSMFKPLHPPHHPTHRRTVLGVDGEVEGKSTGVVEGWLDEKISDFNDDNGQPAALWHVTYTSGPLKGDEVRGDGRAPCIALHRIARPPAPPVPYVHHHPSSLGLLHPCRRFPPLSTSPSTILVAPLTCPTSPAYHLPPALTCLTHSASSSLLLATMTRRVHWTPMNHDCGRTKCQVRSTP